jgi:hypothetical protein
MTKFLIAALIAIPAVGSAQVLSTAAPNNGSGGVFMDLTPSTMPLSITGFQTYFASVAGTPATVEIYTRPGSYVGFESNSAGWTLHATVNATSAGSAGLSGIFSPPTPISIGAGQTMGVYLHSITTGGGIRYTGTSASPPQTTWTNADLTLFGAHARTGATPFVGTPFTPRTFAGSVHYEVVPEPGTMAALALGTAALLRRRRKAQA